MVAVSNYIRFNTTLPYILYLFLIFTLPEFTQYVDNLLYSCTVLCENEYFIQSTLTFNNVTSCPLVLLCFLTTIKIFYQYFLFHSTSSLRCSFVLYSINYTNNSCLADMFGLRRRRQTQIKARSCLTNVLCCLEEITK